MSRTNRHNRTRKQEGLTLQQTLVAIAALTTASIALVFATDAKIEAKAEQNTEYLDSTPSSQPQIGTFCVYAEDGSRIKLDVTKVDLDGVEAIPTTTTFPPKPDDHLYTDEALGLPTTLVPATTTAAPSITTAPPTAEEMMENRLSAVPC